MDKKLIKAVEEQLGSEGEELKADYENVANHGADGGFSGFIYFTETFEFYRKNQKAIVAEVEALAQDLGEEPVNMVRYFNCLSHDTKDRKRESDYTTAEVALTLYGTPKQHNQYVANALVWFALEEVARHETDK
jgi:hypothetical protein